jgi:hypothetical protein
VYFEENMKSAKHCEAGAKFASNGSGASPQSFGYFAIWQSNIKVT